MQIDYPRWPSGAVTKNGINTKYLKNHCLKSIQLTNCAPECFLYEGVLILCNLAFQDGHLLPLLKIAQNVKMTISP